MNDIHHSQNDAAQFSLKLRNSTWSSVALLAGVKAEDVTAPAALREEIRNDIWGDMIAEHDAENLWSYLRDGHIEISKELEAVLNEWRKDELNHYLGLRQICSLLYDVSESQIDIEARRRTADFKPISHLISDEFSLCAVLAYDELVSILGYRSHFDSYRRLGPESFDRWIRLAARDESFHCQNFLDIIATHHRHRAPEARALFDRVLEYEFSPGMGYHATFLLDHLDEALQPGFLPSSARTMCDRIQRQSSPQGAYSAFSPDPFLPDETTAI